MEKSFGDYLIEIDGNHAVVRRKDNEPANPSWYELQYMKNIAFGGDAFAIEVFPSQRNLVDGQNQRHLWKTEKYRIPDLSDGMNIESSENSLHKHIVSNNEVSVCRDETHECGVSTTGFCTICQLPYLKAN